MATLALSVAGQFAGALVGGPIGATIGRALGALAGNAIDGMLFGDKPEAASFDVRLGGSSEGAAIPRLYGWGRMAGNIIWARELERLGGETSGAKGLGGGQEKDEIGASFAIGFCEGKVARLGRLWADGQVLDTRGLTLRFYDGSDEQLPDSLIEATQGSGKAPAYRGLCYIVFENLPLSRFGNRIPQITAELCRVVGDLEPAIRAVTVIPGATEFGYDPAPRVRVLGPGQGVSENAHLVSGVSDWTASLDELQDLCPNLAHVSLVVAWFGDDLRCGSCAIGPRVEAAVREIEGVTWSVAGLGRAEVPVVSTHDGGPAYGGTPADSAVLAAIADLKARGLQVTLYPLILMDLPPGNGIPDPYGGAEQAAYPWRGRVTCDPAPGQAGSPHRTGAVRDQIDAFAASYRAMILHYAALAAAIGGVDALLIGSELVGLTTLRAEGDAFPFVEALIDLVAEVRAVVGPQTKLTYAADWSEYSGTGEGGEKVFHLDPLWAAPEIDAVGIDCYMPLSDWRDGETHLDRQVARNSYDLDYLAGNIAGGEGFDWYYASAAERMAQQRTPITDGAYGEPWVWRYKDIRSFWSLHHHDRPGGVRSATPTAWVPGSKPVWLTEIGCGAVDKGANQPNIFGDEKSAEDGRPYFSAGTPDGLIQRQVLRAHHRFWANADNNPAGMVDRERLTCWTWDARPFPAFPGLADIWADGPNHATGHWLTGRLGALASDELIAAIASEHGCAVEAAAGAPLIGGYTLSRPGSAREAIEPVLDVAGLELRASAGKLVAEPAATAAPMAFVEEHLAEGEGPVITKRRAQAEERPARLTVSHFERERDYQSATATAVRPGTGPLDMQATAFVLDPSDARLAAERLLDLRGSQQDSLEFALPPALLAVEVGDRVALDGTPYEIAEIRDGATRRVVAHAVPPADAVGVGGDRPEYRGEVAKPLVAPLVVAAHLPARPDAPGQTRLVLGAYANPWPGWVQVTEETTGAELCRLDRPMVAGRLLAPMAPGATAVWDDASTAEIVLQSGHLADAAEAAVLGGANRLAVATDAGGWEVLGFARAELVAPRQYRLTRLLRGLEGTGEAMGIASAGNAVVVLDTRLVSLPVDPQGLGAPRLLRVYAGRMDTTGRLVEVALEAGPARLLAPVHLAAARQTNGDIALDWMRCSRGDTGNWGVAEAQSDALPEMYRVTIRSGPSVKRIWVSNAAEATYTLADQIVDFGAMAESFTFSVAQISPLLGDGYLAEGVFDE
ncbi:glycoside hydrolase/phage tail family protein [Devosia sp. PTR5]|uniref:Glycoside hydrolase/phage tail family protein n=1 Tax=Devosia oryzisoli TaxID=2774138 RepID=A0A927ISY9_9HYPH|nr:glycoside hydrolase TIM-barrel-like domain-containing protein [Devosia oryzisoli]MBD8065327.1 glycoside hydrolase/phage tail family protein [Devosia oryzisoli]